MLCFMVAAQLCNVIVQHCDRWSRSPVVHVNWASGLIRRQFDTCCGKNSPTGRQISRADRLCRKLVGETKLKPKSRREMSHEFSGPFYASIKRPRSNAGSYELERPDVIVLRAELGG
jgi:hypothetical protein